MPIIDRSFTYRDKIRVSHEDLVLAKAGRKTCTIRIGRIGVAREELALTDGREALPIRVTNVDSQRLYSQLTDEDARAEGLESVEALREDLSRWYGRIEAEQPITVIHFQIVC